MKVLIIEYEDCIKYLMKELFLKYQMISHFNFQRNLETYDLLVLDMNQQPNDINSKLVYISDNQEEVYKSYMTDSFFFLRKDYLEEDIRRMILKYKKRSSDFIELPCKGKTIKLVYQKIIYLEKQKDLLIIHYKSQQITFRYPLYKVGTLLHHYDFYQFSQSIIVNLNEIIEVRKNYIVMSNNDKLYYTRRGKTKFKEIYMTYKTKGAVLAP